MIGFHEQPQSSHPHQDLRPDPRADVDAAVQAGADAVGFVLYERSPRYVTPERAAHWHADLPPFVTPVLLFVNEDAEFRHELAHFVGRPSPVYHAAR
jgi:hypothetical protein